MTFALYPEFEALKKGESRVFYYQELNPPDRSKVELLELRWTHDRVDGDLVFGSLQIPGIGELDLDAYVYRPSVRHDSAWLSSIDLPWGIGGADRSHITGGPLRKEELLPSEISTRSDRRERTSANGQRVVPFEADEYQAIRRWQSGMNEKGFDCDFHLQPYVDHKRSIVPLLSTGIVREHLKGSLEIRRLRLGFRRFAYSISCSDGSFRSPKSNQFVKKARPSSTSFLFEKCSSFEEMLRIIDKAIDGLVLRNKHYCRLPVNLIQA